MKNIFKKISLLLTPCLVIIFFVGNTKASSECVTTPINENTEGILPDAKNVEPHICANNFIVKIKDPTLKEALLIKLGRKYSTDSKDIDKPEYYTNIPLTYYDLSRVNYLVIPTSLGKVKDLTGLENCINLTSLNLSGQNEIENFSIIGNLTNLVSLNLSETNLTLDREHANACDFIENLKDLRILDLHSNKISNLNFLKELTNLFSLDVTGKVGQTKNETISDLSPLEKLTKLHLLYLSNNNINDLKTLTNLTQLTALHLANNDNISNIEPLSTLTSLVDLDLNNNSIYSIEDLYFLTNLEHLCVEHNKIYDIENIPVLRKLETLKLKDNRISNILPITQLLKLNYVTLSDQKVVISKESANEDEPLKMHDSMYSQLEKKTLPETSVNEKKCSRYNFTLKDIIFHDCKTSFDGIVYIIDDNLNDDNQEEIFSEIKDNISSDYIPTTVDSDVTITDNNLKLEILKTLGRIDKTDTLDNYKSNDGTDNFKKLDDIKITPYEMSTINYLTAQNKGIKTLAGLQYCINLTALDLYGNNISDITYLAGLRNLVNLNLGDNTHLKADSAGYESYLSNIKALANLTNLTTLSVFKNAVTDITPIKNLTSLTSLYIDNNKISFTLDATNKDNNKAISKNIANKDSIFNNLTNLKILFISNNNLKDFDLSFLAVLTNLTTLNLKDCKINSIENLRHKLTNLITLDISNSKTPDKDEGISDLSPVSDMKKLKFLYLNNNNISDISPLNDLKELEFLPMYANKISDLSQLTKLESNKEPNSELNMKPSLKYVNLIDQRVTLDDINFSKDISIKNPITPFNDSTVVNIGPYDTDKTLPQGKVEQGDNSKISFANLSTELTGVYFRVSSRLLLNSNYPDINHRILYTANVYQPLKKTTADNK